MVASCVNVWEARYRPQMNGKPVIASFCMGGVVSILVSARAVVLDLKLHCTSLRSLLFEVKESEGQPSASYQPCDCTSGGCVALSLCPLLLCPSIVA
jgi:hypothetical protein